MFEQRCTFKQGNQMKSFSHLYEGLLDEGNICISIYEGLKHRKKTDTVIRMRDPVNVGKYAKRIKEKLLSEELPSKYPRQEKIIYEPNAGKSRSIHVPNHYEHIVHHLVCKQLEPLFRRGMYEYTVASIPERGDIYGKRYLDRWIRQNRNRELYVLKIDIHHFFDSIDRNLLFSKLHSKIRDSRFTNVLKKIIWYDGNYQGRGIPIGFYTSQWFANFFLQDLDHMIKETWQVPCYVRYMDDLVLIDYDKKKLHSILCLIMEYLHSVGLRINDSWQVFRFSYFNLEKKKEQGRAIDFMGYVFHYNRTVLRKKTLSRIRKKAARLSRKYYSGKKITWYDATQFLSRLGRTYHTNTHRYVARWVLPLVDIEYLKSLIRNHMKTIRRYDYAKSSLSEGREYFHSGCPRYHIVTDVCIS